MKTLLVLTDQTFPRRTDGRPDATEIARYRLARGLDDALVLLVADAYPGSRDDALLAVAHDLVWQVSYLNTTRTRSNPYEESILRWLRSSGCRFDEIVLYGMGLWA